jgi:hypothetical protein
MASSFDRREPLPDMTQLRHSASANLGVRDTPIDRCVDRETALGDAWPLCIATTCGYLRPRPETCGQA